jgi:hypothetical protein
MSRPSRSRTRAFVYAPGSDQNAAQLAQRDRDGDPGGTVIRIARDALPGDVELLLVDRGRGKRFARSLEQLSLARQHE